MTAAPKCFLCGEFYPEKRGTRHQVVFRRTVTDEDNREVAEWERKERLCLACYGLYMDKT